MKQKIKAGDEVVILTGNDRGERGKVLQVFPKQDRILVEGVNKRKFHEKAQGEQQEGGIHEREAPVHISNVMNAERYDARQSKRS